MGKIALKIQNVKEIIVSTTYVVQHQLTVAMHIAILENPVLHAHRIAELAHRQKVLAERAVEEQHQ